MTAFARQRDEAWRPAHAILAELRPHEPARMAERLGADPRMAILNDVVLDQVLVRVRDDDAATEATLRRVQDDGICWLGGTRRRGRAAMRIAVSNWATTEADADRSAEAILAAAGDSRGTLRRAAGGRRIGQVMSRRMVDPDAFNAFEASTFPPRPGSRLAPSRRPIEPA